MIDLLDVKDIDEYIQKSVNDPSLEMEYIFGSKPNESRKVLTKDMFMRLLSLCNSKYAKIETTTNLDIRIEEIRKGRSKLSDLRITLKDLNSIKEYCKKDEFKENMNIEYIKKTTHYEKEKRYSIQNIDYNYRINLKVEQELGKASSETIDVLDDWKNKKKYFRYKRRVSFITNDRLFRIDITAVKNNKYNSVIRNYNLYKSFKESNILNEPEEYELEVEYIGNLKINGELNIQSYLNKQSDFNKSEFVSVLEGNNYTSPSLIGSTSGVNIVSKLSETDDISEILSLIDTDTIKGIKNVMNKVIYEIHSFIYDTKLIMKKSEKQKILDEYYELTEQTKQKKRFMAPQPVTLNMNGINIESGGNIIANYVVTEKADGERYMLFINDKQKGYLINNKLEVKYTGIIFNKIIGEWLIDGEYITKDKYNRDINLYMIFDVYYAGNEREKPLYKYPFIARKGQGRYDIFEVLNMYISERENENKEDIRSLVKEYALKYFHNNNLRIDIESIVEKIIMNSNFLLTDKSAIDYLNEKLV